MKRDRVEVCDLSKFDSKKMSTVEFRQPPTAPIYMQFLASILLSSTSKVLSKGNKEISMDFRYAVQLSL